MDLSRLSGDGPGESSAPLPDPFWALPRGPARRAAQRAWSDAVLRAAVGTAAGVSPQTVQPTRLASGAPVVTWAHDADPPHVSVSHSGSILACAVSASPVGVDIERADVPRDLQRLAESICSPDELSWFRAQPEPRHAFYRLWTGKEAVFKLRRPNANGAGALGVRFIVAGPVLAPPGDVTQVEYREPAPALMCSVASAHDGAVPFTVELQWLTRVEVA